MGFYINTTMMLVVLIFGFGLCCGQNSPNDGPILRAKRERYRNTAVLLMWVLLIFWIMAAYGLI